MRDKGKKISERGEVVRQREKLEKQRGRRKNRFMFRNVSGRNTQCHGSVAFKRVLVYKSSSQSTFFKLEFTSQKQLQEIIKSKSPQE
jgi:hypothetical protein